MQTVNGKLFLENRTGASGIPALFLPGSPPLVACGGPGCQNQAAFRPDGAERQSNIDCDLLETDIRHPEVVRDAQIHGDAGRTLVPGAGHSRNTTGFTRRSKRSSSRCAQAGCGARCRGERAGRNFKPSALWVCRSSSRQIPASREGKITTDGWSGYKIAGHELRAPADATVVERLKAATARCPGPDEHAGLRRERHDRRASFGRTGNAYDVRFSPGRSSGGTVHGGHGQPGDARDGHRRRNSIRMPAAASGVVGLFADRGLVSMAGIAPLDWLLDDTGPIAQRHGRGHRIERSGWRGSARCPHGWFRGEAAAPSVHPDLKPTRSGANGWGSPAFVMRGAGVRSKIPSSLFP